MKMERVRRVRQDEATDWLDRQSEFYIHNQQQASRLIQLVIGAGALTAAVLSGSFDAIIDILANDGSSILDTNVASDILNATQDVGSIIGYLVIVSSLILIGDSVAWALKVMRTEKPQPAVGHSDRNGTIDIRIREKDTESADREQKEKQSQLSNWLNYNHELLLEMDNDLNRAYTQVSRGAGVFLVGLLFILNSRAGSDFSIYIMMSMILLLGSARGYNYASVCYMIFTRNIASEGVRGTLKIAVENVRQSLDMRSNSIGINLLFIFCAVFVYLSSLIAVISLTIGFFMPVEAY